MTRPRRTDEPAPRKTRGKRPADLHPLLVETHDVWLRSKMTATEASAQTGASPSSIYGWFMGRGRPMFWPLDQMMQMVGHHFKITPGAREGIELLESSNASGLRRYERPPDDVHPLLVEVDGLWRKSGVAIGDAAVALRMSPGPLYGWFTGTSKPGLLELDSFVGLIGFRLTVVRGVRPHSMSGNVPK